jgi:hypothetical protein
MLDPPLSPSRSRIHERTILLRFLGIILRVLRLEVPVWISETIGKGAWFSIRFSSCPLQCTVTELYKYVRGLSEFEEICKRLCEFEEIDI